MCMNEINLVANLSEIFGSNTRVVDADLHRNKRAFCGCLCCKVTGIDMKRLSDCLETADC